MITKLGLKDNSAIARIHADSLKGDFLPSLGEEFLTHLYAGIIANPHNICIGDKSGGKVNAFLVGTADVGLFLRKALLSNFFSLSIAMIKRLLLNPKLLGNLIETLTYTSKENGPKSELVVIAVKNEFQGKGLGANLIRSLEREYKKRGIDIYKLTVHADKKAVDFYKHLGFKKIGSFDLYSKNWLVLEKKII